MQPFPFARCIVQDVRKKLEKFWAHFVQSFKSFQPFQSEIKLK